MKKIFKLDEKLITQHKGTTQQVAFKEDIKEFIKIILDKFELDAWQRARLIELAGDKLITK